MVWGKKVLTAQGVEIRGDKGIVQGRGRCAGGVGRIY